MLLIEDIYLGAARLINQYIREEFQAQGHTLTGAFESSLDSKQTKTRYTATLTGIGLRYGMDVDRGYEPQQVSMKMFPGLVDYFTKRGLDKFNAMRAAGATIAKWKVEGMSTQASKRFSKTGARQNFVEAAFVVHDHIIDEFMTGLFDEGIEQAFKRTKDETV